MRRVYYKGTFTNKTTKLYPRVDENTYSTKWKIIRVEDRFTGRRLKRDKKDSKSNSPNIGRKNRKDKHSDFFF